MLVLVSEFDEDSISDRSSAGLEEQDLDGRGKKKKKVPLACYEYALPFQPSPGASLEKRKRSADLIGRSEGGWFVDK